MKRCKVHGRTVCLRCLLVTLGFPVEHVLWEKVPVFRAVTRALGL